MQKAQMYDETGVRAVMQRRTDKLQKELADLRQYAENELAKADKAVKRAEEELRKKPGSTIYKRALETAKRKKEDVLASMAELRKVELNVRRIAESVKKGDR